MDIIANYGTTLILVAALFGFFMAWGIGANDVANAMGTSVGTRSLTIKQAILIAMVFEFAGAYLAGGEVTSTIKNGIIDSAAFADTPDLLVFGMIASLLAAGTWLLLASYFGWPVSTTHSIIGAIIGFALVSLGSEAVHWNKVAGVVGSWIITPALSGVLAYFTFISVQRLIFNADNPLAAAKKYVPIYIFMTVMVICLVTLKKGLKHVGMDMTDFQSWGLSILVSLISAVLCGLYIKRQQYNPSDDKDMHFSNVEKVFGILMVVTACAMAFAHGSNDVANAVGPLAAVISVVQTGGEIGGSALVPWWVLVLGGSGIVVGLVTYGHKVIATVGTGITELTPSRGFAATLAAATTVVLASGTGLPISTTHTLVGAILGVGLARGMAALNLRVIGTIAASWLITLPAGAGLAILFFFMFKGMFG